MVETFLNSRNNVINHDCGRNKDFWGMSLGCSKMDLICSSNQYVDFQQSYIHSKGRMHSSSAENVVNSVGIPRSLVGWG